MPVQGKPTDGWQVWRWPEFRAFAERLGIDLNLPTTSLTITLDVGQAPEVVQTYRGRDLAQPDPKEPEALVVDQTSVLNEKWRTASPYGGGE